MFRIEESQLIIQQTGFPDTCRRAVSAQEILKECVAKGTRQRMIVTDGVLASGQSLPLCPPTPPIFLGCCVGAVLFCRFLSSADRSDASDSGRFFPIKSHVGAIQAYSCWSVVGKTTDGCKVFSMDGDIAPLRTRPDAFRSGVYEVGGGRVR